MHDAFEWWANIWVPASLGVATIAVAVVAAITSRNASILARRVESMRFADDNRREADAARLRLIEMASADARSLMRWTVEATRKRTWAESVSRPLTAPPPPRTPLEEARIAASVQLATSLVPGASELLQLTEFDIASRYEQLPDDGFDGEGPDAKLAAAIVRARDKRMFDRIKAWGLDPVPAEAGILRDLEMATSDAENYLKIGLSGRP